MPTKIANNFFIVWATDLKYTFWKSSEKMGKHVNITESIVYLKLILLRQSKLTVHLR